MLSLVLERRFIPDRCSKASDRYISSVRAAVRLWSTDLGREATTAEFTNAALMRFLSNLQTARYGPDSVREYAKALRALWRHAHRLGLAPPYEGIFIARRRGVARKYYVVGKRRKFSERIEPPAAPPGTVWHYFVHVFAAQELIGAARCTLVDYECYLNSLYTHHQRHVAWSEINNGFVAEHFRWTLEQGGTAWAVNNFRKHFFAVWRHAASRGIIDRPPLLRPLRVHRGAPDAWTIDEMKRILAAADDWWQAMLLVGYWTLQRRRALFSIPTANVDIEGGWIDFPPSAMKAGVGIRCRIGADAVAAIRRLAPLTGERLFTWGRKGSYLGREFSGILRRAGVPPSKRKNGQFHKLRRTAATHLAARGHLQTVCDLLGHSQVYVGKRVYL